MAGYAAIAATSQGILGRLEAGVAGDAGFGTVACSICTSADLQAPFSDRLAVTLCLCYVAADVGLRG
jgi:hypothetical protein